ncbi:MAG: class I SAM-dependent methyltransferase [Candidatus Omnitrophica bacterium]|nr:class I SAM-dependent methyltransferase [Candidatus Omnitrophota bacterium]MBU1808074.1 class I SAM-dependent methyltransferase [Candidatus Omnitrophota bacterium]
MGKTCSICNSDKDVVLQDSVLNRYGCNKCHHSFTVVTEEQRTRYTDDYYETHANWFNHPNYRLFDFIHSQVISRIRKDGLKLIDVGCGTGDFLKYLRKKDPSLDLYGIDLRPNSYPGIAFVRGDILRENIGMKLDAVTSLAAIEHVDDINLFIENIKELLAPGGILVIMTDNTGGVFYSAARLLKKMGIKAPYEGLYELAHLHHFTNTSLRKLLECHGLEVISRKNHNYPLRAINYPSCGTLMRVAYMCGAGALFAFPSRFGILQTVVCRKKKDG